MICANATNLSTRIASLISIIATTQCLSAEPAAVVAEPQDSISIIENNLWQALTGGKADVFLRYRFEYVDDGTPGKRDAYANTLRSAIGYSTDLFYGFGLYGQFEDVRALGGDDDYDDGGSNGIFDHAQVVDPEGTEIQQANIRYAGLPNTVFRAGRQEIEHRQAPMHRYIGNILWRQNWQSFDAMRLTSQYVPNLNIDYAYVWNVNRIFGENNPIPDRSNFRMNSHLVNLQYTGLSLGKLEAYAYLLDFDTDTAARFSTQTYGLRFDGAFAVNEPAKILSTLEYAHQGDYAENPNDIDVNYYLAELGGSYNLGGILESVMVKASYEVLEGDGGVAAFQTPLGTNHAFQGWADRFLVTPGDGIEDFFVTAKAVVYGTTIMGVYHNFSADNGNYDYGTEWDVLVERPFFKHYTVGLKYADYDADEGLQNQLLNTRSGQAFDLTKAWAYIQVKF